MKLFPSSSDMEYWKDVILKKASPDLPGLLMNTGDIKKREEPRWFVVRCKASGEGRVREGEEAEERRGVEASAVSPHHVPLQTEVSWPQRVRYFQLQRNPMRGRARGYHSNTLSHMLGALRCCVMRWVSRRDAVIILRTNPNLNPDKEDVCWMTSAETGTQRGAQMKGDMLVTVVLNIFKWFGELFIETMEGPAVHVHLEIASDDLICHYGFEVVCCSCNEYRPLFCPVPNTPNRGQHLNTSHPLT